MSPAVRYLAIGASVAIIAVCARSVFKAAGGGKPQMPEAMQKEPPPLR